MRADLQRTFMLLSALATAALINAGPSARAAEAPSYCAELKEIASLALMTGRFASIVGAPREGNFLDSKIALPGWGDCALYGKRTYTCDSRGFKTAEEAELAHGRVVDEAKACLGDGWSKVSDQASRGYAVLHDARHIVAITINTDVTGNGEHVVRLIMFPRSR
jgi:hypothetical protein